MLPVIFEKAGLPGYSDSELNTQSLEGMLRQAFTQHVAEDYKDKVAVLKSARDPVNATDPEMLYQYQLRTSEYNIKISLYSTLTRKAVTAVDTLIRA